MGVSGVPPDRTNALAFRNFFVPSQANRRQGRPPPPRGPQRRRQRPPPLRLPRAAAAPAPPPPRAAAPPLLPSAPAPPPPAAAAAGAPGGNGPAAPGCDTAAARRTAALDAAGGRAGGRSVTPSRHAARVVHVRQLSPRWRARSERLFICGARGEGRGSSKPGDGGLASAAGVTRAPAGARAAPRAARAPWRTHGFFCRRPKAPGADSLGAPTAAAAAAAAAALYLLVSFIRVWGVVGRGGGARASAGSLHGHRMHGEGWRAPPARGPCACRSGLLRTHASCLLCPTPRPGRPGAPRRTTSVRCALILGLGGGHTTSVRCALLLGPGGGHTTSVRCALILGLGGGCKNVPAAWCSLSLFISNLIHHSRPN